MPIFLSEPTPREELEVHCALGSAAPMPESDRPHFVARSGARLSKKLEGRRLLLQSTCLGLFVQLQRLRLPHATMQLKNLHKGFTVGAQTIRTGGWVS